MPEARRIDYARMKQPSTEAAAISSQALFGSIGLGVVCYNAQGSIISANPAAQRVLGIAVDPHDPRGWTEHYERLLSEDGSPLPREMHPATLAFKSGLPVLDVMLGVDHGSRGRTVWVRVSAIPEADIPENLATGASTPRCVYVILEDITEQRDAEIALQRGEDLRRKTLGTAPIILWAVDARGIITLAEGSGLAKMGLIPEDRIGRCVFDVIDDPDARAAWARALDGENVAYDSSVGEVHLHTELWPQRDTSGTVNGLVGNSLIITERRRAEDALRQLGSAVASATEGVVVVDACRKDYPITYVNPAFLERTGYSEDEVVGKNCRFLQGPDTDPDAVAQIRKSIRKRTPCRVTLLNYRKDGATFWNDLTITPVLDSCGNTTHFVGIQHDVTSVKEADRAVRDSEQQLRLAIESGNLAPWEMDLTDGELHSITPVHKSLYGLTADQEMSIAVRDRAMDPDDLAEVKRLILESIRSGTSFKTEFRVTWPDGSEHWLLGHGQPIYDADGRPLKVVGTTQDITERKLSENMLRVAAERQAVLMSLQEEIDRAAGDLDRTLEIIVRRAQELTSADGAAIEIVENEVLVMRIVSGSIAGQAGVRVPCEGTLSGLSIREKRPLISGDVENDPRVTWTVPPGLRTRSLVVVPVQFLGKVVGILKIFSVTPNSLGEDLVPLLRLVANMIVAVISGAAEAEARRALSLSEERQHFALEEAGIGTWHWDIATDIITGTERSVELFGLPKGAQITREELYSVIHPDDCAIPKAAIERSVKTGDVYDVEYRVVWPDGSAHWIAARGRGYRNSDGKLEYFEGTVQNIDSRKAAEAELRRSHEQLVVSDRRLRLALESGDLGFYELDADTGEFLEVSETYLSQLGLKSGDEFNLQRLIGMVHPDDRAMMSEIARRSKDKGLGFKAEHRVVCPDGSVRWLSIQSTRVIKDGRNCLIGIHQDITDRKALEVEREHLLTKTESLLAEASERADRDPVTNLLNHRAFHKRLADEVTMARRTETSVGVVMMDLDNFKFFNDVYGHSLGDEVLRLVADRLRAACGPCDIIARFGGDEFSLLLTAVDGRSGPDIEADLSRKLGNLEIQPRGSDETIPITVSFGATIITPEQGSNPKAHQIALDVADERLRLAKVGGGVAAEADMVRITATGRVNGFSMLDALVAAVDNKDRYTRRHSEDVMAYCLMIAGELGFDREALDILAVAALLHDVGKIGVPDYILRKPGKLTNEEFDAIKQHPTMGAIIVQAVPGLESTLDAVRHHHERWDGRGYPSGLKGEECPLMARLMAVADAFSAMTTDRPYRKGMPHAKAFSILEAGAGSQWDPECVRAFLRSMGHRGELGDS